jgi:hypothetical protein
VGYSGPPTQDRVTTGRPRFNSAACDPGKVRARSALSSNAPLELLILRCKVR